MAIPVISLRNMVSVKRHADHLSKKYPFESRAALLDQAAHELFGVRHFRELRAWRKAAIDTHVIRNGNIAECTFCGLTFASDIPSDIRTHQARHDRYEEAVTALSYHPLDYREREAVKTEGYRDMGENNPLEQRIEGAIKILRSWFDRSLDAAIDGGYWKKHPQFETYVSYSIPYPRVFPKDIETALIKRYGSIPGVMEAGHSYWYPPKAKKAA